MAKVQKMLLVPLLMVLAIGASLLSTNKALAAYTPMTSACLGGTLVRSASYTEGTLRIYKSCGAYYAQFGTKGGARTFWIDIININWPDYWSKTNHTNKYGGWTNLIPGACVGATVKVTNFTAKTIRYGC
jgi:hypothetical protein